MVQKSVIKEEKKDWFTSLNRMAINLHLPFYYYSLCLKHLKALVNISSAWVDAAYML